MERCSTCLTGLLRLSKRSKDREYRKWRAQVIRRDRRCVVCDSTYRRAAHHLDCWAYFPTKRYDVDNGVVLCGHCHSQFHNNYKRSYRQKCTKADWDNFIELVKYLKKL